MANAALFIGFGNAVPGRERQALQAFNESIQYYVRLQQQGEIESFEPILLEPHGGDLAGYVLLRGEREKLDRVHASQEFRHLVNQALLAASNIGVVNAYMGEDLNRELADWGDQASHLG
jgi:hypothetical protein